MSLRWLAVAALFVVVSNTLTFGLFGVDRVEWMHDWYCTGQIDALTPFCP